MKYIIKSTKNGIMYFHSEILKGVNHFVADIDEAKVFDNKWKAKAQLLKLSRLRDFKYFEIIKKVK